MIKKLLCVLMLAVALLAESDKQLNNYLSELVAMATVTSDKSANKKALDWVEKELTPIGLHIKRHEFNGHPALIATTKKNKTPRYFSCRTY